MSALDKLAELVKGDTGKPVREALFRRCTRKGQWMYGGHWTRNGEDGDACPKCDGTGFQRRSLAESALMLPDAIVRMGYTVEMTIDSSGYCEAEIYPDGYMGYELEKRTVIGEADKWLDALASALADAEATRRKGVPND